MKYDIVLSAKFKKGLKRARKRGLDITLLKSVVDKLQYDIPLEEKYRDHELIGILRGFRECHIQPDWLLIYSKEASTLILTLVATGTHSDVLDL